MFGMDIIFDEDWKPYLIEGNANPGMWLKGSTSIFITCNNLT